MEEQVGRLGFEGDVADLIDDEQGVAAQAQEFLLESAAVVGLGQAGYPFGGGGEEHPVPGLTGADGDADSQMGLAGSGSEGDRLQQLRAVLPCEVRVVAETHPLFGRLLAAKSFKRWNGVLLLVIDLPDGSPGTIRCEYASTNVRFAFDLFFDFFFASVGSETTTKRASNNSDLIFIINGVRKLGILLFRFCCSTIFRLNNIHFIDQPPCPTEFINDKKCVANVN